MTTNSDFGGAVDSHVHVWSNDSIRYPYTLGYNPEDSVLPSFLPEDILAHAKPCGIERIVLVQMSCYGVDNLYMTDVIRAYDGLFSGIAVIDPDTEKPDREMERLAEKGVRGFRIKPEGVPLERWMEGPGWDRMFAAGAERRLALCPLIDPEALPGLSRKCEKFPDTPIIIDHLCRIGADGHIRREHVDALCEMAAFPAVMLKVSAFYALGKKTAPYDDLIPLIRRVYTAFGAKRLMWASDCPFQVLNGHTYTDSISLVHGLDFLSDAEQADILRHTAESFFFDV